MKRWVLGLLLVLGSAWAVVPGTLAPGVPELDEAEGRLTHFVRMSEAIGDAVARMQVAWTQLSPAPASCDDPVRIQLGWRIERFGAAWREAAQAGAAQSRRTRDALDAPTVTPLIDAPWRGRVTRLMDRASTQERAFRDASAWQNRFVRPYLSACPIPEPVAHPGLVSTVVEAQGDAEAPVAVLAMGDGWVCPARDRADDAVVLVDAGRACWSATDDCACDPAPVRAGAVLTNPVPAVVEEVAPPEPAAPAPAPAPKPKVKTKGPGPEKGPPAP